MQKGILFRGHSPTLVIYLNKVLQMFLMVVLCWSGTSGLERAWIVLGEVFMPLSVIVKTETVQLGTGGFSSRKDSVEVIPSSYTKET